MKRLPRIAEALALRSVAFVSARYPPNIGGIETHVSELATRASSRFDRVFVLTTDPTGHLPAMQWSREGPIIYRVRSFAPRENFHFPQIQTFVRRLRQCRSQILHLHGIHDLPGPIAGLMETESCSVFTPHFSGSFYSRLGRIFFAIYRPLIKELIQRVDAIICVSKFEASSLQRAFPESSGKVHIIPNGVDFDRTSTHRWLEPVRPTILFAGRLERHKNVDKIIQAFAVLQKTNSAIRLIIVGRGPVKDELVELAASLGLESKIEWIDGAEKGRLYELYSSSTVVVMPSEFEAYGLVAAEAISLGVPTIVANTSALSDFVSAGLAEPVDPPVTREKLLDRISQILKDPVAFSRKWSTGGIILSWEEVAERTYRLYESVFTQ